MTILTSPFFAVRVRYLRGKRYTFATRNSPTVLREPTKVKTAACRKKQAGYNDIISLHRKTFGHTASLALPKVIFLFLFLSVLRGKLFSFDKE